jgi:serine protease Do
VDVDGRVIAINTAIIPFAHGIGFAIPINLAKKCANEIITNKISARPWLGIIGLTVTDELSRYYGLPVKSGVLVTKIADGSPAEDVGIVAGDIILGMDNVEIHSIEDLVGEIHKRRIGDKVKIFVLRQGQEHFFEVTLSKMP